MAKSSDVETFCALRLFIDSWRWEGVPWYLRSGKYLACLLYTSIMHEEGGVTDPQENTGDSK